MKYTVPDYYREFKCIASDCPATCCAGWQIVIDEKSLKRYEAFRGPFGSRLANSIDWREKTFQQYGKRCAFLNEENLCDIYAEAGPEMLCRTCRRYPRHVEEFENEREISLSLSCPVVAEMLMGRRQKVFFIERQNDLEEKEDEEFDFFLYSALQDCRKLMLQILQDRGKQIEIRMAAVLALAHDVQNRIDSRRIFDIEALLERYGRVGASEGLRRKLERYRKTEACGPEKGNQEEVRGSRAGMQKDQGSAAVQMNRSRRLLRLLNELEVLDETWPRWLRLCRETLYGKGGAEYLRQRMNCAKIWRQESAEKDCAKIWRQESTWESRAEDRTQDCSWADIELEQLMVYFLFTYFCGAVYDGDVLSKTKMAVVSTLILREMELTQQIRKGSAVITREERAQIAWRYSRELEHSDLNLNKMEELMNTSEAASFDELLYCIMEMSV
ncbi:MAG: flagellin lysine-N-methylase [Lachnospiraceae bacterium]|nr:flagellin lysine-N-methylase [Lachnospiraceae bacterium]